MKKNIAVIFGGYSPEYDVSLVSSHSIIKAMDRSKYEIMPIGITREGEWLRYAGPIDDILGDKWHTDRNLLKPAIISPSRGVGLIEFAGERAVSAPLDAVFPVLHGKYGEDGTVQGLCELAGIPVVGCGSAASALCMDKDRAHKLVSYAGIDVPKSISFERPPADGELLGRAKELRLPLFVKPSKTGSSFGISKVEKLAELPQAVKYAFTYDDAVILEEGVDGFEAGCAVVGNHELKIGRVDEIELAHGFFDYEEKYTLKTSKIHTPARIDGQTERALQEAAALIYRTLGCRGYARVDMFLTKEGGILFNEANTIPGFTPHSRFPRMMSGVGMDFGGLVETLIELALRDAADLA